MAVNFTFRPSVSRLVTLAAFAVGIILFGRLWRSFGAELDFSLLGTSGWLVLLALPLPAFWVMLARLQLILRHFGLFARPLPLLAVVLSSRAVGYLLPGGTLTELGMRTVFLAHAGVTTKQAVIANTIDGLVRFAVNSILLFVMAAYFVVANFADPAAQLTVVAGLILSLLGLITLLVVLFSGIDRWFLTTAARLTRRQYSLTTLKEWKTEFLSFFRSNRRAVLWTSLLTALGFFLEPLQAVVLMRLLGVSLPFWVAFYFYQALTVPRILPVPGGLGVVEEGGGLFAALVGGRASLLFAGSLLWRVREVPYLLLGLLLIPFLSLLRVTTSTADGLQPLLKKQ